MLEGLFGVLAFFATLLALVAGIVVAAAALIGHHRAQAMRVVGLLLGWIVLYSLLLLTFSLTSRPRYLAQGQERCFDEMCYSVKAVTRTPHLIGDGQQAAQGEFYVVAIQLRSSSKGTAQKPSQPSVFVMDASGRRYSHFVNAGSEMDLPIGQPVTSAQLWDQKIQPGETIVRTVAFDLPASVDRPGLVVTEGIGPLSAVVIGDENSFLHSKTEFSLTP